MIEIVASKHGAARQQTTAARALGELYAAVSSPTGGSLSRRPSAEAWDAIGEVIAREDPWCRGVLLLGLEAPEAELERAFHVAAKAPVVRGFAVGRTIFADAARAWLTGTMHDADAVDDMAERFGRLVRLFDEARSARAA